MKTTTQKTTIHRIKEFIDFKSLSVRAFESSVGFSNGSFASQLKNNKTIGVDKVENILQTYPEINPEWLLTGNGEMIKQSNIPTSLIGKDEMIKSGLPTYPSHLVGKEETSFEKMINQGFAKMLKKHNSIPLVELSDSDNIDVKVPLKHEKYMVPEFIDLNVDFMMKVKGPMMQPNYNSGDIVACKKLPIDTFFQWGRVYVLDTVQEPMIKRVLKSNNKDSIRCVSDNKNYEPFDLQRSEVQSLYIVLGVIKLD